MNKWTWMKVSESLIWYVHWCAFELKSNDNDQNCVRRYFQSSRHLLLRSLVWMMLASDCGQKRLTLSAGCCCWWDEEEEVEEVEVELVLIFLLAPVVLAQLLPLFSERSSSVEVMVGEHLPTLPPTAPEATSSWWIVLAESSIGCKMRRRALMNLNTRENLVKLLVTKNS